MRFLFFFLPFFCEKPPVVPVSSSAKLLPSCKIATINQEVLKEATSNFMDDFFQLLQHYSHQPRALLRHFFPHFHPPSLPPSIQPVSLWFRRGWQKESLSALSLIHFGWLPCLLMLTQLKLVFPIPTLKPSTFKDVEHEVLKIWQASLKSHGEEPCPRYFWCGRTIVAFKIF